MVFCVGNGSQPQRQCSCMETSVSSVQNPFGLVSLFFGLVEAEEIGKFTIMKLCLGCIRFSIILF